MIRFLPFLTVMLGLGGGMLANELPCAAAAPNEANEPPQPNPYPLGEEEAKPEEAKSQARGIAGKQAPPAASDRAPDPSPAPPRLQRRTPAPVVSTNPAPPPAPNLSIGSLLGSARELRLAAEAGEGIAQDVTGAVEASTFHMSEMSRQFDPFGFKEAFRTIQQQNATIQRQQATIQRLLEAEIARLRRAAGEPPLSAGKEDVPLESTADPNAPHRGTKAAL